MKKRILFFLFIMLTTSFVAALEFTAESRELLIAAESEKNMPRLSLHLQTPDGNREVLMVILSSSLSNRNGTRMLLVREAVLSLHTGPLYLYNFSVNLEAQLLVARADTRVSGNLYSRGDVSLSARSFGYFIAGGLPLVYCDLRVNGKTVGDIPLMAGEDFTDRLTGGIPLEGGQFRINGYDVQFSSGRISIEELHLQGVVVDFYGHMATVDKLVIDPAGGDIISYSGLSMEGFGENMRFSVGAEVGYQVDLLATGGRPVEGGYSFDMIVPVLPNSSRDTSVPLDIRFDDFQISILEPAERRVEFADPETGRRRTLRFDYDGWDLDLNSATLSPRGLQFDGRAILYIDAGGRADRSVFQFDNIRISSRGEAMVTRSAEAIDTSYRNSYYSPAYFDGLRVQTHEMSFRKEEGRGTVLVIERYSIPRIDGYVLFTGENIRLDSSGQILSGSSDGSTGTEPVDLESAPGVRVRIDGWSVDQRGFRFRGGLGFESELEIVDRNIPIPFDDLKLGRGFQTGRIDVPEGFRFLWRGLLFQASALRLQLNFDRLEFYNAHWVNGSTGQLFTLREENPQRNRSADEPNLKINYQGMLWTNYLLNPLRDGGGGGESGIEGLPVIRNARLSHEGELVASLFLPVPAFPGVQLMVNDILIGRDGRPELGGGSAQIPLGYQLNGISSHPFSYRFYEGYLRNGGMNFHEITINPLNSRIDGSIRLFDVRISNDGDLFHGNTGTGTLNVDGFMVNPQQFQECDDRAMYLSGRASYSDENVRDIRFVFDRWEIRHDGSIGGIDADFSASDGSGLRMVYADQQLTIAVPGITLMADPPGEIHRMAANDIGGGEEEIFGWIAFHRPQIRINLIQVDTDIETVWYNIYSRKLYFLPGDDPRE
jgi:hypothetical protein